jgi:pilus assembly protein CpaF
VHLVVHIARLSDGSRKIERISEVLGIEDGEIAIRDIFVYEQKGVSADGRADGTFRATGHVPTFSDRLRTAGLDVDESLFREGYLSSPAQAAQRPVTEEQTR